ncbi:hypothetical protein EZ456_09415 [Pedobacter psychrodurus]|uniref:LVIVD repeat-containing protein n=1 Tax=Pedobacter psychrodurus TaxID=2530456 RepID=A0A4R0PX69_9SPHI|nr:hypothetical protein [Pedobacter psychrodurus]TCD27405.1 hypothetical protein EZ456_09415 [Pedobacter psychrodurus]
MKKNLINAVLFLLVFAVFTNCKKDEYEIIQIVKMISVEQMRALPVGMTKAVQAKKTGKIYIYNDYLFINEPNEGIHIYNNVNPSAPVNVGFLQIPGNVDLAIHNNILYADNFIDLLAFDISNMSSIKQVKRVTDVFNQFYLPGAQKYLYIYKDTLVKKQTYKGVINDLAYSGNSSSGQGGSMARFTLMNDYLYTVGVNNLSLFDVKTASNPTFLKAINLGWGVETIFPYESKLFIGTNRGMHIFSATDPANPVQLSTYSHIFACDPVVVQGKYAYVTLRTGNMCRQASNQLEIVDIEDPTKPKQLAVYPMQNPHGLSTSGDHLFLCEGNYGIKSFNIANKTKIGDNMLQHLSNIKSFDVIAGPKSLIVTGEDGVYQFNYSDAAHLKQLSVIKVQL